MWLHMISAARNDESCASGVTPQLCVLERRSYTTPPQHTSSSSTYYSTMDMYMCVHILFICIYYRIYHPASRYICISVLLHQRILHSIYIVLVRILCYTMYTTSEYLMLDLIFGYTVIQTLDTLYIRHLIVPSLRNNHGAGMPSSLDIYIYIIHRGHMG